MQPVTELLRQGKKRELWEKHCGYLDLDMKGFMSIQRNLLQEQIGKLADSKIGGKIIGTAPSTIEEFRERVPLTTYSDYQDYLLEKREDVLPEKPYIWGHTSGRSGEYKYKWVPYTRGMFDTMAEGAIASFLLASSKRKGDVFLEEGDRVIYTLAPPPYMSGLIMQGLVEQFNFRVFPPVERSVRMQFQERIQEGLLTAMAEGLDWFYGITSIMMRISEQFSQRDRSGGTSDEMKKLLKKPKVLLKMVTAMLKAKLHSRVLLPRDIWKLKGVQCGGTDTAIFKEKIRDYWGKPPLEGYASTELGIVAYQSWNHSEGLVFRPNSGFYEFIPAKDYYRMRNSPGYKPAALLMDELEPDKEYVLVGTNFHGGALVRYITSDLFKVVSLEDAVLGLMLPQLVFVARADDVIDIGGFTRLTEKTLWQAIEDVNIPYVDWTVRKEYHDEKAVLHLYMELKDDEPDIRHIEGSIHERLKELDEPYRELESMVEINPLHVSALTRGTFQRYFNERQAAGADLAHLKPSHMNPPDDVIKNLLRMSNWQL
jgi:hypothetical protein